MAEEKFSGFIRSSKSHSVSVSEHTGNAKTVRNKVSSDEQVIEARKTAFEKQSAEDKANIQKVHSDDKQETRQSVAADISKTNRQETNQGQGVIANTQDVPIGKPIQDNVQKIPSGGISRNNQAVNIGAVTPNVQGVGKNNIATNQQNIGQGNVAANNQKVPKSNGISTNVQGVPVDGVVTNNQPLLNSASPANDGKAAKLALEDNKQVIAEQALDTNLQHLENLALSLNMHRVPEDGLTATNRQPTDKENLKDHFEVLPSEKIERAEVDFGLSVPVSSSESHEIFLKIKVKQQEGAAVTDRPLTAQQAAKLKHDKYVEAFRGRLAGIKRGVDALNGRLDVMEKGK